MNIGLLSKKQILVGIIVVLSSLVAAYTLGFWSASHSQSYIDACDFARRDARLASEIGPVRDCRLSSWFGYNIHYEGPNGSAQFRLHVIGEKGDGDLFVNLAINDGEWQVETAKLKLPSNGFLTIR